MMLERARFMLRLRRGRSLDDAGVPPVVAPAPAELDPIADHPDRSPLDAYRGVGRLGREPQCPTCGRFGVDHQTDEGVLALSCRACGSRWRWQPGTPWPRTVPDPQLESTKE